MSQDVCCLARPENCGISVVSAAARIRTAATTDQAEEREVALPLPFHSMTGIF